MDFNSFFKELKRRNVFKVATAYAIAGWLIIQVAATVSPQLNFPDWVPSAITIFVLCGFPLALIFAWAFELTPEGLKKSNTTTTTQEFDKSKSKKINSTIIAVLCLAIVFLLGERILFAGSSNDEVSEASIAVLPFVNMSDDQNNEYFSDGLSEELLNGLAKIEGMQVAGRTSSFSFKGKNEDLRLIGEELSVNHILEGSVRKDGENIRITAQLIKADDGYHIWSETYDRKLKSIFEIQEEISREVIKELKVRILPEEEKSIKALPTVSTEAYDLYLQATQVEVSRKANDLQRSADLYKQAIALDPNFSLAHSRLAIVYSLLNQYGNLRLEESSMLMQQHIDKALAIGDDVGMAYLAQGMAYMDIPGDSSFIKADQNYKKALKYLPNNAYLHNMMHINYKNANKIDLADEYLLKAYQLDPLSPPVATNTAGYYLGEKNYDMANKIADKIAEMYPDYMAIYNVKFGLLVNAPKGDLVSAFKLMHKLAKQSPKELNILLRITAVCNNLNLLELSQVYTDRMRLLYPNNFEVSRRIFELNSLKGNHQQNLDMLQTFVDRFGEIATRVIAEPQVASLFKMGEYENAIQVIEMAFPEFKNNTIEINNETVDGKPYGLIGTARQYALCLRKMGQIDKAENIAAKIANYDGYDSFKDKPTDSLTLAELFKKYRFQGLMGKPDAMADLGYERYFNRKSKIGGIFTYVEDSFIQFYKDNEKVQQHKANVLADINSMRSEVINYLKSEGDWDESWSEEPLAK